MPFSPSMVFPEDDFFLLSIDPSTQRDDNPNSNPRLTILRYPSGWLGVDGRCFSFDT